MNHRARRPLAAVLWLCGVVVLGWALWPASRVIRVLRLGAGDVNQAWNADGPGTGNAAMTEEAALTVVLDYPQALRLGDSDFVRLRISRPSGPAEVSPIERGAAGHTAIQAALELSGAVVLPEGDITMPWLPDVGASFVWTIRGAAGPSTRGTAWTFLVPIGSSDLASERVALAAMPLMIQQTTFLGCPGPAARFTGAAIMILGTIVGMPLLEDVLRQAITWARRKGR